VLLLLFDVMVKIGHKVIYGIYNNESDSFITQSIYYCSQLWQRVEKKVK
jgi:hypothetical protein